MRRDPNTTGLICHICGIWKPLTELVKNKHSSIGVTSTCLACAKIKNMAWSHAHPENVEASRDRWDEANPGKAEIAIAKWKINHPDKIQAADARYTKSHPDKCRAKTQLRTARKQALPCTFTNDDWIVCLEYWHNVCAYCGNPPNESYRCKKLTQEHHIPQSPSYELTEPNPGYVAANIVPACKACNSRKWNSDPSEWVVKRFGRHESVQILGEIERYFKWVKGQL